MLLITVTISKRDKSKNGFCKDTNAEINNLDNNKT